MPANSKVGKLLEDPNFGATPQAASDLEGGLVDKRLIATLEVLTKEHRICVQTFKEGHYFLPGVPDGPRIPQGYGKAGGLPNTHYFGRAADVWWIDGKLPDRRPAEVIGFTLLLSIELVSGRGRNPKEG